MPDLFTLENYPLIMLSMFYVIVITYLAWRWQRNKDKLLVRIRYPTEKRMLVNPEGSKVTLRKGSGKGSSYIPSWKVDFDLSCLYFVKSFLSKRLALEVMPDATKAISFHRDINEADIPLWTRAEHNEYATLTGLRALQSLGEQKPNNLFWIIIILELIAIVMPLAIMKGLI